MVTGFEYDKLQTQKALVKAINRLATSFQEMVNAINEAYKEFGQGVTNIRLTPEQMEEFAAIVAKIKLSQVETYTNNQLHESRERLKHDS